MFKGKMSVNLDLPILKLQKELQKVAQRVIIPDIEGRINSGVDINGKSYRSLTPSTIKQKQKKGLRTEKLIATGQLRKSFDFDPINKNSVRITLKGTRNSQGGERVLTNKELADILQNQGVNAKAGKRFFNFFGISKKAEFKSIKMMQQFIKAAIARGGRRTIR